MSRKTAMTVLAALGLTMLTTTTADAASYPAWAARAARPSIAVIHRVPLRPVLFRCHHGHAARPIPHAMRNPERRHVGQNAPTPRPFVTPAGYYPSGLHTPRPRPCLAG